MKIYSPKEYGVKVIGKLHNGGGYIIEDLDNHSLQVWFRHSNPPARACIKWKGGFLEFANTILYI